MHLFKEATLKSAVTLVLGTLSPLTVKPLDGDVDKITKSMQPILASILTLVVPKSKSNVAKKKNKTDDSLYLHDCTKSKSLMAKWVAKKVKENIGKGSTTGALVLDKGAEVPGVDATYCLVSTRVGRRRATARKLYCVVVLACRCSIVSLFHCVYVPLCRCSFVSLFIRVAVHSCRCSILYYITLPMTVCPV